MEYSVEHRPATMAILSQFVLITCVFIFANAAPKRELSNIVQNKNLGIIRNPNEANILKKFLEKNPDVKKEEELRGTTIKTRALTVSPIYPDGRALIDVLPGTPNYIGHVEVYFNGGQPIDPTINREPINLSLITKTYLKNLKKTATDDQIKQAFLNNNPSLPRDLLNNVLKVRRFPNERKASLYVENYTGFEGHAIVTW